MKITSLLENTTVRDDVQTEHGLSLYIETGRNVILFDMGQTDMFVGNALVLKKDLEAVDFAVLSHGHYDHGGGMAEFMRLNRRAPVYVSRYAFGPYYHGEDRYVGLDMALKESQQIIYVGDEYEICEGVRLFSCNDRERRHSFGSFGMKVKNENGACEDDFRHEQYLLLEEGGRRVLISGCSHKGIVDIVRWFEPDVLIGGFHFSNMPLDDKLAQTAKLLDSFPTEYYTCHCTGQDQFEFMKRNMTRLHYLSCGESIDIK